MSLQEHCIQGAILSAVMIPFTGGEVALLFFVAFVLIDIDHYIMYVCNTGKLDFSGVFSYCNKMTAYHDKIANYCCFHSVEAVVLLALAGSFIHPLFFVILVAFSLHMVFDMWQLWREGRFFARVYSVAGYLKKKRSGNYITNLPEERTIWERVFQTESHER